MLLDLLQQALVRELVPMLFISHGFIYQTRVRENTLDAFGNHGRYANRVHSRATAR